MSSAANNLKGIEPSHTASYLWPVVCEVLSRLHPPPQRVFDLGCGTGATAAMLSKLGYRVTGIDSSVSAIDAAQSADNDLDLHVGSAYDELATSYGQFPVVISLEVVEHCYYPHRFARTFRSLLAEKGVGIISTPYHGYWKNLALAVSGRMDSHFTALWEGGHIKFWSIRTLTQLLAEAGFHRFRIVRAGRIPALAKSMVAIIEG